MEFRTPASSQEHVAGNIVKEETLKHVEIIPSYNVHDGMINDHRKMESDHSDCPDEHVHDTSQVYTMNQHDDGEHVHESAQVFSLNQHEDGDHGDESSHSFEDSATKVYIMASMVDDDDTSAVTKRNDEEQPKRTLFGPPCWKPEQLMQAIDAVKNGHSVTEAGKLFGIPRTTLSNKIYGRRRRNKSNPVSKSSEVRVSSPSTSGGNKLSHNIKLNINVEIMLANFISKQNNILPFVLTTTVFDLIRHFGKPKANVVFSDDYVKNWIRYFFIRHPKARFDVCTLHNVMTPYENEEKRFVDFIDERFEMKEKIETIKNNLFELVKEVCNIEQVNALWWYYFLKKYPKTKRVLLKNLQWCETIFDDTLLQGDMNCSIKVALTELTLASNHEISPLQESRLEELRTLSYSEGNSYDVTPDKHLSKIRVRRCYQTDQSRSSDSTNNRFHEDMSSGNDETMETVSDYAEPTPQTSQSSSNVKSMSLKETLALEGLRAVERNLSAEDLNFFNLRYSNPHLEEAYDVWKNLKSACSVKSQSKNNSNS